MGLKRNLSTPENREFWKSIDETARQVEHWPKWMGGEGKSPICCPHCNRPAADDKTVVSVKILGRNAYIQMPVKLYRKIEAVLKRLREAEK
jgi:hypothetical protein